METIEALKLADALFKARPLLCQMFPVSMLQTAMETSKALALQHRSGKFTIQFSETDITVTWKNGMKICTNPDELTKVLVEIL